MNLSRRAHPRVRVRERLDRLRKQDGVPPMIAITQENTRNLPTSVKTTTEMVPFKLRKEAVGEAQFELGPEARPGFEFDVSKCDGGWRWRRVAVDECMAKLATNGAQLKANGGKKSLLAQAVAIEAKNGTVPQEVLAGAFDEVAEKIETVSIEKERSEARQLRALEEQAKLDTAKGASGIPAFLKRDPDTAEQKEARIAKHKKTTGPGRVIKNPPNIKDAKAKASKGKRAGDKGQTKTALVGQLLLRKEGCTTADILAATGWPTVSVPAQAKAVGIGLRKEKDGKVTRYFGVPKK